MAYTPSSSNSKYPSVLNLDLPDGVKLYVNKGESMDVQIGTFYGFGLTFSERVIPVQGSPFIFLADLLENAAKQIRKQYE